MPLTVRLNARTERALDALARSRRQTRSDVVREALEQFTASNSGDAARSRPYDAWVDVIGIVSAGTRERKGTTGEQFAALLREKARARRPR